MQKLYFREGLLGTDWARDIRMDISAEGFLVSIETDVAVPEGSLQLGVVLPAMPNLHSHAFQRVFAGLTEYTEAGQSNFWSWRTAMYQFAAQMTPDALRVIASTLYIEMLKAGYTTVGEFHYLHNSHQDMALAMSGAVIAAADDTGIALTHLPVLYQASDFGGKKPETGQQPFLHTKEEFIRLLRILSPCVQGRHMLGVAFHSLRAVREDSFGPVIAALEVINPTAPIHIHIAEQMSEVEASLAHSGKRPVAWLLDNHQVDDRWCLVHATHLVEAEWQAVAATGAIVGLCPTTEANLGDGLFPVPEYVACGGRWGIGSDSHISVDAREEVRLLEYGQRLARQERTVLSAGQGGHTGLNLWATAAQGGAQALAQPVGSLAVGKRADLIVLDTATPAFAGACHGQIMDAFVFSGQPNPISDVMVAGNWVIQKGKHAAEDTIFAAYSTLVATLTKYKDTTQ
ncbi:MAG: formimidoylglutamate deiminase [Kordiimonadaceae bacterium]|nr:formimidoylglutamate deiminase [Kordiimonadaceae bacterium]